MDKSQIPKACGKSLKTTPYSHVQLCNCMQSTRVALISFTFILSWAWVRPHLLHEMSE